MIVNLYIIVYFLTGIVSSQNVVVDIFDYSFD